MKIAPNLRRFLQVGSLPAKSKGGPWTKESADLWVAADRDFRALLAVARASMREHEWTPGATPCRPDCQRCRAFRRVDRLSAPVRRPGALARAGGRKAR